MKDLTRWFKTLQMRESGASYAEIGRELGVSSARAKQLVRKARKERSSTTSPLDARTRNCLKRHGVVFSSREELRALYAALHDKKTVNPRVLRQIERWLDLDW